MKILLFEVVVCLHHNKVIGGASTFGLFCCVTFFPIEKGTNSKRLSGEEPPASVSVAQSTNCGRDGLNTNMLSRPTDTASPWHSTTKWWATLIQVL